MQNEATLDSLEFDPNAVPSPHAGEDVPAYAVGKGSSAVSGVLEQKELFKVISDVIFDKRVSVTLSRKTSIVLSRSETRRSIISRLIVIRQLMEIIDAVTRHSSH